jgi:subtilisin family serine protease/subtilisin-like proprotein convertase family protein
MQAFERRILLASIAGTAWNDYNANGVIDAGEPGLNNWTVFVDDNNNGVFDGTADSRTQNTPLPLPDIRTPQYSSLTITDLPGTIADLNVTLNVTHTFNGDLDIFLISPTGTRVELMTDCGGSGDGFFITLDDEALTSVVAMPTTGTPTGTFRPEGLLSAVDGQNMNGTWQIEVTDDAAGDSGTLNFWTLTFSSGERSFVTSSTGAYSFPNMPAGTHVVRQIDQTGWNQTHPAGGFHTVNLPDPSSAATNINFGNRQPPGSISGFAYRDLNANGVRDTGEPGLAGVEVYIDSNNSGTKDAGEPSTFSAANGSYSFLNLPPGTYVVREILPSNFFQTQPGSGGATGRGSDIGATDSPVVDENNPLGTQNYSSTEVVAMVADKRGVRKLREFVGWDTGLLGRAIDAPQSRQIHREPRQALVEVKLRPGQDPIKVIEALNRQDFIAWAAPNYIYALNSDPRDLTPNDPQYGSQYHHPLMKNNLAWDITLGNPNIIIAVTDDGMQYTHPDLSPNIWINAGEIAGNGIDDDGNGFIDDIRGWDFWTNDNDPSHLGSDSHGTHVGGIAAGRTNNGINIAGTAGGSRLMNLRFYGSSGGTWTSTKIADSYAYARNNGAKIVSTSYNYDGWATGGVPDPTVNAAFDASYAVGTLFFNSAGNNGALNPNRGVFDQTLFVVSTTNTDTKSSFSNYGFRMDISAPGSDILSTLPTNSTGLNSGTSMATPNAAGVAALIWSANPTWTRDQVAAQLIGTADNIDALNPSFAGNLGSGRVNSFRGVTETLTGPKFRSTTLPAEGATLLTAPTSFFIQLGNVFNPATVNLSNFSLVGNGLDDVFGTADDQVIPLSLGAGFSYKVGTNRLNFTITGPMGSDQYRFTASTGLTDPFGNPIDGDGNGVGGDAFVRNFAIVGPTNPWTVTIAPGQDKTNINFGNFPTRFVGSNGDDSYTVQRDGSGTRIEITETTPSETLVYSILQASTPPLAIAPGAGNDTITINYTNGNPLPASFLSVDGGANSDTLIVIGSAGTDGLNLNGQTFTMTGVSSPVNGSNLEQIQLNGAGAADTINVVESTATVQVNILASAGDDTINVNTDNSGSASVTLLGAHSLQSLSIGNGGSATVGGVDNLLFTRQLSVGASGVLDLLANDMVVDYSESSSVYAAIRALIASGRNGGFWNGAGIRTSSATSITGLGILESSDYIAANGTNVFAGATVGAEAVLVKYTWNGDTDLNGVVDFDDYARVDSGFLGGGNNWFLGDSDHNGVVDFDDFALIDLAYLGQSGIL